MQTCVSQQKYLLRGGGGGGGGGPGLEDGGVEDDEGLDDAGLVGVVHQRGQGHCGAGGARPHQGRPEHDAQVTGTHLVVLLQLRDPGGGRGNQFVFIRLSKK